MNDKKKKAKVSGGLSITPTITALLKPTADYLGTELRDYVKASIEELKEKRRASNINEHLKSVQEKLASEPPGNLDSKPTFEQIKHFDQWFENAQDVDPENEELSDLWRNLLARAARGENTPNEVVETLKSLSPREAKFLSNFNDSKSLLRSEDDSDETRHLAKALESKAILEKNYTLGVFLILVSFFMISISGYYVLNGEVEPPFSSDRLIMVVIFVFMLVIFPAILSLLNRWRLSWLGKELLYLVQGERSRS